MQKWKYIGAFITPLVIFLAIYSGSELSWLSVPFFFGLLPLLELLQKPNPKNLEKWEEEMAKNDSFYDYIIYLVVPIQYALLFYGLYQLNLENISIATQFGLAVSMGLSCGILGINVAHELGHRNTTFEQTLSLLLLLTSQYMHFFIEHNKGHHKNVSTPQDPSSSRYGESVYRFYFRSIVLGYASAWKIERERLEKLGKNIFSISNQMIQFLLVQIGFVVLISFIFNPTTAVFYLISAAVGILLLETVNYIEHYGLSRSLKGGVYERTTPIHSWNSDHPIGRIVLFELSRHSDHHYLPNRKYQLLRHHPNSPQMPTGYPGMMILSLIPPLWYKIMHRKIAKIEEERLESFRA